MVNKGSGWHNESKRHALAVQKGLKTRYGKPTTVRKKSRIVVRKPNVLSKEELDRLFPESPKMTYIEAVERIGTGRPTWELKQMLKANDFGVARFMGGMDAVKDVEAIKTILKFRKKAEKKLKSD
jgi:hypothetical protein